MKPASVIASSVMNGLLASIRLGGPDTRTVSARIGLGSDALFAESDFMPLAAFTSALEIASEEKNDPLLGLKLGIEFEFHALGSLAALFLTAPTLKEGLTQFSRHFPALQSNTRSALVVENDVARFSYAIHDDKVRHKTQDADTLPALWLLAGGKTPSCFQKRFWISLSAPAETNIATSGSPVKCPTFYTTGRNASILWPPSRLGSPPLFASMVASISITLREISE